jgi:hypothetical protein
MTADEHYNLEDEVNPDPFPYSMSLMQKKKNQVTTVC